MKTKIGELMIISSQELEQYPELVNFFQATSKKKLKQMQQFLAPSYTGLSIPHAEFTPLEIAALLKKTMHIKYLLSLPTLTPGAFPHLVTKYLYELMEKNSEFTPYLITSVKLFTDASQFIALNKISSDGAVWLIRNSKTCERITFLFSSAKKFIELAEGSSWSSQYMAMNSATHIVRLFKTPQEFNQLAPMGGPVSCLLEEASVCEQIARLYNTADEFITLARNSEGLRSASAALALNEKSTEIVANLFSNPDKFIELTQTCSLTAQYLSIPEKSCIIIAKTFESPQQFSRLVNTKTLAPYYLTLHQKSCEIIARLFTDHAQLHELDKVIEMCPFYLSAGHYTKCLGPFLSHEEAPKESVKAIAVSHQHTQRVKPFTPLKAPNEFFKAIDVSNQQAEEKLDSSLEC